MEIQDLSTFGLETLQVIGKGAFSQVMEVRNRSGSHFALKQVHKHIYAKLTQSPQTQSEVRLSHRNLIDTIQTFQTHSYIYSRMELARGGTLRQLIQRRKIQGFSRGEVAQTANALLSAIIYLHRLNIIHRDIKPDNILLMENQLFTSVKLGDYNLSAFRYDRAELRKQKGTPQYMAPQIIAPDGPYDKAIDVWSIGLVLFEMFSRGRHLIKAKSVTELQEKIRCFVYEQQPDLSEDENDFISYILKADPAHRPQPYEILLHPFLSQYLNTRPALNYSDTLACFENQQTIIRSLRALLFLQCQSQSQPEFSLETEIFSFKLQNETFSNCDSPTSTYQFKIRRIYNPYDPALLKTLESKPAKRRDKAVDMSCHACREVEDLIGSIMKGPQKSARLRTKETLPPLNKKEEHISSNKKRERHKVLRDSICQYSNIL